MAKMSEFIAFRAAVELLKERDMKDIIASAYRKSKDQIGLPKEQMVNYVKEIYAPFTDEEISAKMVELLTPKGTKAKVEISTSHWKGFMNLSQLLGRLVL